jgi:Asp-tRNA(Asn)/Glu-tRNA(Gln) amidotransferase C subunit
MARKQKAHEEELPFVALMDTMTNVVGVLIIVLVMIGIGLARTVQKVLSDLPMVSEEEHQTLKGEVAQFDDKRDPVEVEAEIEQIKQDLEKVVARVRQLEEEEKKIPPLPEDLQKMLQELEKLRKDRDQRKLTVQELLAQIDKLKVALDTTPKPKVGPAITARLPNPKPMPEKAQMHRILVTENRLFLIRKDEVLQMVEQELKKESPAILAKTGKSLLSAPTVSAPKGAPSAPKQLIFDPTKITNYFNTKFNFRAPNSRDPNRDVLIEVAQQPNSPNMTLTLHPRPDAGETLDQARQNGSIFRFFVHALKADPRSVISFSVNKNAIGTYLAARDIVDVEGVPVVWEINDALKFTYPVPANYLVQFTPPPKPPAPPPSSLPPPGGPAPAGPPPVTIAAPKASVD